MGKAVYDMTDEELSLSCGGFEGYSRIPRMPCIGRTVHKVEMVDGRYMVGATVICTTSAGGHIHPTVRHELRLCNHARFLCCKVCEGRFIAHQSALYCSPECRKSVAKQAVARYRAKQKANAKWWREREDSWICEGCGDDAHVPVRQRKSRRFCSDACRQLAYRKRSAERAAADAPPAFPDPPRPAT
jgi:hypothetical protein